MELWENDFIIDSIMKILCVHYETHARHWRERNRDGEILHGKL